MRSFWRFLIISFYVVAALILLCAVVISILDRPPKEDKVVNDFKAHRLAFDVFAPCFPRRKAWRA